MFWNFENRTIIKRATGILVFHHGSRPEPKWGVATVVIKSRSTASAYPHTPTDHRHTDKHFKLVMTLLCSKLAILSFAARTDRHTDRRTDATKYIISLTSRSIMMIIQWERGPLLNIKCLVWLIGVIDSWPIPPCRYLAYSIKPIIPLHCVAYYRLLCVPNGCQME